MSKNKITIDYVMHKRPKELRESIRARLYERDKVRETICTRKKPCEREIVRERDCAREKRGR